MVGNPALGEVVGSDALGAVTGANQLATVRRLLVLLFGLSSIQ